MKYIFRKIFLCGIITISFVHTSGAEDISSLCEQIKTNETLSADYKPGVDVHGNKVVPADINSSASNFLNDPIVIPLEVDLIERFGLSLPTEITLNPTVANIQIHQDGRIQYNDKDVSDKIISECQKEEKNRNNTVEEHGHKPKDTVPSSDKIEGQYPDDTTPPRSKYND